MEEMAELEEMAREKTAGMSLLLKRDNEIRGIRDGTILASTVSQSVNTLSTHSVKSICMFVHIYTVYNICTRM